MILTIQPLKAVENVLVPIGDAWRSGSDHLYSKRAVIEHCRERNWEISPRSETLARCVSSETIPNYVVKSEGGVFLAVWVEVAA